MKVTQEERVKTIKSFVKAFRSGKRLSTKAELIAQYTEDVSYLLKALAKAQKPSV